MDSAVKPQNDHMLFLHANFWTMPNIIIYLILMLLVNTEHIECKFIMLPENRGLLATFKPCFLVARIASVEIVTSY